MAPRPGTPPQPPDSSAQPVLLTPSVLAGIAVPGPIVLAIIVVFVFGSPGGGASSADKNDSGDPLAGALTAGSGRGVPARSIATATVREGPGLDYQAIGELVRNQDVEVIGRNADSSWVSIYYPPGSHLKGW